jgi:hypothetical protein
MSYADELLSTDERVLHRAKQHWFVFVWGAKYPLLAVVLGLIVLVLSQNLDAGQRDGPLGLAMNIAVVVLVLGGLAVFGWHVLRYLNQEYVLTNRRVVQVAGVLNKTSMDSSLEKINDARLSQSVFGRMFGFGDLDILTAADTGVDRFRMLRDPIAFKRAMLDAKHEYERDVAGGTYSAPNPPLRAAGVAPGTDTAQRSAGAGLGPAAAPSTDGSATTRTAAPPPDTGPTRLSPDDVTRTLSSLADLRDRGAISAEEYDRKKSELLARL